MEKNSVIITKDGKYLKEEYKLEKELVKDIIDKSKEIFGEKIHYFKDEKLIKSKSGRGTRTDGFAIDFEKNILYVIEVELKKHSVKKHISPQIQNFLLALNNPAEKKPLIEFFINDLKKRNINKTFNEIEKVFKNWRVLVIIDEITLELIEFLSSLYEYEKRIITIPFQTYKKENSNEKLHYFQSFTIESLKTEVARKWNFKWTEISVEDNLKDVSENMKEVFNELKKNICEISPEIKEVHRTKLANFQISALKNFCSIKFKKDYLEINLKVDKDNFVDKNNLCENIDRTSSWAFDKIIRMNSLDNLNEIIDLIRQSHLCICKK